MTSDRKCTVFATKDSAFNLISDTKSKLSYLCESKNECFFKAKFSLFRLSRDRKRTYYAAKDLPFKLISDKKIRNHTLVTGSVHFLQQRIPHLT